MGLFSRSSSNAVAPLPAPVAPAQPTSPKPLFERPVSAGAAVGAASIGAGAAGSGRARNSGSRPAATAMDAPTNPSNNGCGRSGRLLNSGWNWLATNHGWSFSSTISTSRPSGDWPLSSMPAPSRVWR